MPDTLSASSRRLLMLLSAVVGITALGGSAQLVLWRHGHASIPLELLRHTPFTSFLVPGILLGVAVGLLNLCCTVMLWRRARAAIDVAVVAGGALCVWLVAELALLRAVSWLMLPYGLLGLSILVLAQTAAWRSAEPRQRWILRVTFGEAIGYLAPAAAGVLSVRSGAGDWAQVFILGCAGFLEGAAFGIGQAWSFPFELRRWRYVMLSGLGASVSWLSAMSLVALLHSRPLALSASIALGCLLGTGGLLAIGALQWLELRRRAAHAGRWVAWTAGAWILALPLSFLPSPLVDEHTPLLSQVALWTLAGLLMAHVMARVTWVGVERLR